MSVYLSDEQQEALYASIHRLALQTIPECTLAQVKKAANRFHNSNASRRDFAFLIYWELAEGRKEGMGASFLDLLREHVETEQKEKPASVRNYWLA